MRIEMGMGVGMGSGEDVRQRIMKVANDWDRFPRAICGDG